MPVLIQILLLRVLWPTATDHADNRAFERCTFTYTYSQNLKKLIICHLKFDIDLSTG